MPIRIPWILKAHEPGDSRSEGECVLRTERRRQIRAFISMVDPEQVFYTGGDMQGIA
jgi:hypothetical protein